MRILVSSVSNAPPEVLEPHLRSVLKQDLPERVNMTLAYISDGLSDEALDVFRRLHEEFEVDMDVADALERPEGAVHEVTEETHDWSLLTFAFLAREKQRLLEYAKEGRFDGIWYVDSDLIVGPETLASLIYASKDVTSATFWTRWTPKAPPLPQVWMRHPYEFDGRGVTAEEFLRRLSERDLMKVGGLGACTLIRSRVFDKVSWFPLVDGLPSGGMWQGEDRHFCVRAERNHVELWADGWPDVHHLYRPSDVREDKDYSYLFSERVSSPSLGDLVSVVLEPLEEKELQTLRVPVRGRLGVLPLLAPIENAIYDMSVGDSRVVEVEFPAFWPVAAYRGKTKNVLLRLLDAKRSPRE